MTVTVPKPRATKLKRRLSLILVVLYGLGVTIGAGIYVLIGETAAQAGIYAPMAFGLAAMVMAFSAATFSEFVGRLPVSAGESAYVQFGFGSRMIALIVGCIVMLAGIVSSATISLGSAGYLAALLTPVVEVDRAWLVLLILLFVALIACIGILESVAFAALFTVIEIGGLIAIIAGGFLTQPDLISQLPSVVPDTLDGEVWATVLSASLLAFFAFIGFEDMVNIAEEVRDPERTMPRAIFITLVIATSLYFLVAAIAVLSVPLDELATSRAPLGLVFGAVTDLPAAVVSAIAIIATFNGIVIQVIMASRVLYGMGDQGTIPGRLGRILAYVPERTGTPVTATALVAIIIVILALNFDISGLATLTSQLILAVFVMVNLALVRVKWRERKGSIDPVGTHIFQVPIMVPVLGAALSFCLLVFGH
ncbi:amino acid permease [Thalassospira sp. HF15]|uniref:APC family permease n=1 Tax=Thalassospira sp. HF15 TaxID=2722755 RepID=UPI001430D669|nr:amino acid permease [Thalassospira sp. HF15]NIY74832.1 amino acid permease [Thalassospira sp. HF15]